MTAAARILHTAIEDAVGQLEPQLLPLFGGLTPNAHELALLPTLRTQLALKRLVALTRYFPEEHRVQQAGRQLELLWPTLAHEPGAMPAGKLLEHYFRVRQDLLDTPERALLRALREMVRAAIDGVQSSGDAVGVADCERRICQLASFLPEAGLAVGHLAEIGPLARLFRWQQALQLAASAPQESDVTSPLLVPHLLAVLDHCTVLCRASDGSLEYYCHSGLAGGLWHLRGMARFSADAAMAELLEELDDTCLDMHLVGSRPQPEALQQWLARLLALTHGRRVVRPPPRRTAPAPEPRFGSIYDQELAQYRRQLQEELQGACADGSTQPLRVSEPLITVLYKLAWVFATAEQPDWARLCHCAYRVALQYWRVRRAVAPGCAALLLNLATKAGTSIDGAVLRHWRWQLLQDWPSWAGDSKRPIALHDDTGAVVALEAVPDLLSGSFTALVQAGCLTDLPSPETCKAHFQTLVQDRASDLLQELALLEKGAAAMKVWPLEQLCTLLIAVYETHLRVDIALPAVLLQDAHRQLVRMLDQAAAWREAQVAEGLVGKLEQWLQESSELRLACREPRDVEPVAEYGDCGQPLRVELMSCLGTLASVLERPVRLHLDAGNVRLEASRMSQLLDCLRPLIKFMLLDQSIDARSRHAMHKPKVSTLTVALRANGATLGITVGEDSHEDMLPQAELQRLQRRLPKAAGALVCESRVGRGRAFTFTLC